MGLFSRFCLTTPTRAPFPGPGPGQEFALQEFGYTVCFAHPARRKGRFAIVTRRGPGGGGRDGVGALGELQGGIPVSSSTRDTTRR
jgi:hypothetical protein